MEKKPKSITPKKFEFKILKVSKNNMIPMYHIVVSKKKSSNNSRLDKVGFFHFAKRYYQKRMLLGLNFEKIKSYIKKGVVFHTSVLKFLV